MAGKRNVRKLALRPPLPVSFRDIEGILDEFIFLMVRDRADAIVALCVAGTGDCLPAS